MATGVLLVRYRIACVACCTCSAMKFGSGSSHQAFGFCQRNLERFFSSGLIVAPARSVVKGVKLAFRTPQAGDIEEDCHRDSEGVWLQCLRAGSLAESYQALSQHAEVDDLGTLCKNWALPPEAKIVFHSPQGQIEPVCALLPHAHIMFSSLRRADMLVERDDLKRSQEDPHKGKIAAQGAAEFPAAQAKDFVF
eukprot:5716095-Amphidinium_carterae.3